MIAQHSTYFGTKKILFFFVEHALDILQFSFLFISSVLFARVLAPITGTSILICVPKSWHENFISTIFF
jgi:hypothetical protein